MTEKQNHAINEAYDKARAVAEKDYVDAKAKARAKANKAISDAEKAKAKAYAKAARAYVEAIAANKKEYADAYARLS